MKRTTVILLVVLVAGLVAGACGSDDLSDSPAKPAAEARTPTPPSTVVETPPTGPTTTALNSEAAPGPVEGPTGGESSDSAPWGLDSVDLPDTEEEIAAVLAAFPEVIDGREDVPGSPLLRTYQLQDQTAGGIPSLWRIWAEDIQPSGEAVLTATETLVSEASNPSAEASAVDPSADLMWVEIYGATEEPPAYLSDVVQTG